MPKFNLIEEIVKRSNSDTWDFAKLEWDLYDTYRVYKGNPETCLCGKHPIFKVCILRNLHNNAQEIVGNCCVKKFDRLDSDKIFNCFTTIQKDNKKPLNIEMIRHAHAKKWIDDWEKSFSNNTRTKRTPSDKQLPYRIKINNKIIRHMSR